MLGDYAEDRMRERELNRYLDSLESSLSECEGSCDQRYLDDDLHQCEECKCILCDSCAEQWHTIDKTYYCHDCYLKLNKENPEEYPLEDK